MPRTMTFRIAAPAGIRRTAVRRTAVRRRGGLAPWILPAAAAAAPYAMKVANPVLEKIGNKLARLIGLGVIRAGSTRATGGKKTARRRY